MTPLDNITIRKGEHDGHRQRYVIDADQGYVNADLLTDMSYRVSYVEVHDEYLGQGYAKELLSVAKEHARSLGAKAITSTDIWLDESAGAVASVFGYEHLNVRTDPKAVSSITALFSDIRLNYPLQDA